MIGSLPFESFKSFVDVAQKSITSLAILSGGGWAYYKYVRGRIFRHRLELSISGVKVPRSTKLLLTLELKNVGSSDIPFRQEGTAVIVESLDLSKPSTDLSAFAFEEDATIAVTVLTDHDWIEPGEMIREQHLVDPAAPNAEAHRLILRVVSEGSSFAKRTAWVSTSIFLFGEGSEGGKT